MSVDGRQLRCRECEWRTNKVRVRSREWSHDVNSWYPNNGASSLTNQDDTPPALDSVGFLITFSLTAYKKSRMYLLKILCKIQSEVGLRTVRITVTAVGFTAVNSVRSLTTVTVFHILNPKRVRYGPETAVNGCYGCFFLYLQKKFTLQEQRAENKNNKITE